MNCLFYKSNSHNPYENLAVEKYFFDTLPQDFFVFYLWQNAHTVVIGRNQNAYSECLVDKLISDGGKLARRMTGGGAVYHDLGNLNFTFIFHNKDYDVKKNFSVIAETLKAFKITAEISGRNDILAEGKKFSGNAFLTSSGKTCHHGTLMVDVDIDKMPKYLNVSKDKLVKHGVKSVSSRVENLNKLCDDITIETLSKALLSSVKQVFSPSKVIDAKVENVALLSESFSKEDYLFGADARFVSRASQSFDWGKVDLDFEIVGDSVDLNGICSDSLETEIFDQIKQKINKIKISELKKYNTQNRIESDIVSLIVRSI